MRQRDDACESESSYKAKVAASQRKVPTQEPDIRAAARLLLLPTNAFFFKIVVAPAREVDVQPPLLRGSACDDDLVLANISLRT